MKKEEESILSQRVNIGPKAQKIRETGVPKRQSADEELLRKTDLSSKQAVKIWLAHAEEAYILTSILSDIVINWAISKRPNHPPFGLIKYGSKRFSDYEPNANVPNLGELRRAMKTSLELAQFLSMSQLEERGRNGAVDPEVEVQKRYEILYQFARNNVAGILENYIDIGAGINSSSNHMTWTLENILEIHLRDFPDRELTLQEYEQIAHNSWPYIASVASQHRHRFRHSSADPKNQLLVLTPNGYRLESSEKALKEAEKRAKESSVKDAEVRPTFNCPALVNFGDGSAIRKLWDWHIDIAHEIYVLKHPNSSIYQLLSES